MAPRHPTVRARIVAHLACLALVAPLAGSVHAQLAPSNEKVVDGIAAQVGGEIVLISEVQRISEPIEARMRAAGMPESEVRVMRADALERLIEQSLIDTVVQQLEFGVHFGPGEVVAVQSGFPMGTTTTVAYGGLIRN